MTMNDVIAHIEVGSCLTRLARGMDDRDWEACARVYADDATADFGEGLLEGSEAIVANYRRYLEPCGPTQHLLGNLLVDVDGPRAESRCYVSDMHLGAGKRADLTFRTLGDYHDQWQKLDGVWRLVRRMKHNRGFVGSHDIFAIDS